MYIADAGNNRIRMVSASGIITTIAGFGPAGYNGDGGQATSAKLSNPSGVTHYNGNLLICDTANHVIRKLVLSTGIITTIAGSVVGYANGPLAGALFSSPYFLILDHLGNMYVGDSKNNAMRMISTSGVVSTLAGTGSTTGGFSGDGSLAVNAELVTPKGATFDNRGNMYIADHGNHRIRILHSR